MNWAKPLFCLGAIDAETLFGKTLRFLTVSVPQRAVALSTPASQLLARISIAAVAALSRPPYASSGGPGSPVSFEHIGPRANVVGPIW